MPGRVAQVTAIAILWLAFLVPVPNALAAEAPGTFTVVQCPLKLPAGLVEGRDLTCGWLTVPEDHSQPDGPTLRLLVVRVSSLGGAPRPDPIVLAQGGPGGSTIDGFLPRLRDKPFLRRDREVILYDQRGTLYTSRPLVCGEILELTDRTIEQDIPPSEADRMSVEALIACRNRLAAEGSDLKDFNTAQNAADLELLRRALGFERINLYGVSYGTLLALNVMRSHPSALRSVILDGVVPAQSNFIAEAPQHNARALRVLFDACAADSDCRQAYPDLESVFYATVDRMNATPARAPMRDRDTGREYNAVVRGDFLISGIVGSLYITDVIPGIPRMIYDARDGRFDALGRIQSLLTFDRTMSYGMYFSVVCAESSDLSVEDLSLDSLPPQLAREGRRSVRSLGETCSRWGVPDLAPELEQPVRSDVPTLLLSGAFDPITPESAAQEAARTLSRSYMFTFPNTGHGALFESECADSIVTSFLREPSSAPDSSCLATQRPPTFLTPANTLFAPGLSRAALGEPVGLIELGVAGGGLSVMMSGFALWPAAWLYRKLSHRPVKRPLPWARRIGLVNSLAATALVGGLIAAAIGMSSGNSALLLFGLPAEWRPLLVLGPVVLVLAGAGCVVAVRAWRLGAWSVLGRLYFTLHCLAAVAIGAVLIRWDLLSALFS